MRVFDTVVLILFSTLPQQKVASEEGKSNAVLFFPSPRRMNETFG